MSIILRLRPSHRGLGHRSETKLRLKTTPKLLRPWSNFSRDIRCVTKPELGTRHPLVTSKNSSPPLWVYAQLFWLRPTIHLWANSPPFVPSSLWKSSHHRTRYGTITLTSLHLSILYVTPSSLLSYILVLPSLLHSLWGSRGGNTTLGASFLSQPLSTLESEPIQLRPHGPPVGPYYSSPTSVASGGASNHLSERTLWSHQPGNKEGTAGTTIRPRRRREEERT